MHLNGDEVLPLGERQRRANNLCIVVGGGIPGCGVRGVDGKGVREIVAMGQLAIDVNGRTVIDRVAENEGLSCWNLGDNDACSKVKGLKVWLRSGQRGGDGRWHAGQGGWGDFPGERGLTRRPA